MSPTKNKKKTVKPDEPRAVEDEPSVVEAEETFPETSPEVPASDETPQEILNENAFVGVDPAVENENTAAPFDANVEASPDAEPPVVFPDEDEPVPDHPAEIVTDAPDLPIQTDQNETQEAMEATPSEPPAAEDASDSLPLGPEAPQLADEPEVELTVEDRVLEYARTQPAGAIDKTKAAVDLGMTVERFSQAWDRLFDLGRVDCWFPYIYPDDLKPKPDAAPTPASQK